MPGPRPEPTPGERAAPAFWKPPEPPPAPGGTTAYSFPANFEEPIKRLAQTVADTVATVESHLRSGDAAAVNKVTGGFLSDLQRRVGRTKTGEWLRYGKEAVAGGEDFGEAVYQWRVDQNIRRALSESEASKAKPATRALSADEQGAIVEHLVRRHPLPENLKDAAEAVKPAFETIRAGRKELVRRGLMSPEVEAQWEYFLRRIFRKPIREALEKGEAAMLASGGKPALRIPKYRMEGHLFEGNVPLEETKAALAKLPPEMQVSWREGGPLQVVTGNEKQSMVRFTETPEGERAARAFESVKPEARSETVGGLTFERGMDYFSPLSPEQRAALDEVRDIPTLVLRTVQDTERQLAADDFFNAMAKGKDDAGSPLVVDLVKNEAPAGYVEVPNTMRYGAVKGRAVKTEVMEWLVERQGEVGGLMSLLNGASDAWAMDALNSPKFGFKQWLGNIAFFDVASGNSRLNPLNRARFDAASKALREWVETGVAPPIIEEMLRKGRVNMVAPTRARLQLGDLADEEIFFASKDKRWHTHGTKIYRLLTGSPLEERGALRAAGGAFSGALREVSQGGGIVEGAVGAVEGAAQNLGLGVKFGKSERSVAERIRDIAEGSDAKSRVSLYLKRKEQAIKAGLSEEQAIVKAGQAVNDEMQNYTRVGGVSKLLTGRGGGRFAPVARAFGPRFFTFKEVVARAILHHLTQRGWQGRADVALALSMSYLVPKAGKEAAIATGLLTREQADDIQKKNPDATLWPGVDQQGRPTVRATTMKGALVGPDTLAPSIVNDVALGGPALGLGYRELAILFQGRDAVDPYTGAPIMWRKYDGLEETKAQAALRVLQETGGSMTPGGRTSRLVEDALTKKYRAQSGEEYDAVGVAGDILVGRSKDVTPGRTKADEGPLAGYSVRIRELKDSTRSGLRDVNIPEEGPERRAAEARATENFYQNWADEVAAMLQKGFKARQLELDSRVTRILRERGVLPK